MMGRILGNHPDVYTFGELHFFGQLYSPPRASQSVGGTSLSRKEDNSEPVGGTSLSRKSVGGTSLSSKEDNSEPVGGTSLSRKKDTSESLSEPEAVELAARLLCIQREGYRTHGNPQRFQEEAREFLAAFSGYPATPAALFSAFLCREAAQNGKSIPCDQTPRNVFYIEDILRFYPQAKVINMIRDPRDVLLSQKRKWKRRFLGGTDMPLRETFRDWINYHPITMSRIWHTAVSAADRFADSDKVMSIYFEELLAQPQATVRQVCDFAGIGYADTLLQVPQVGSSSGADKPTQLGINPTRANSWQKSSGSGEPALSSAEIYLCETLNAPLMKKHNYPIVSRRPNPVRLAIDVLSFPMKLTAAFLCNLDRMKNIRETLKRRI